jgi:hypothetical protein
VKNKKDKEIKKINRKAAHQPGRPAHHAENAFRNPWPTYENRGCGDLLKWHWNRLHGKAPKKPERYDFRITENDGQYLRARGEQFTATWIGHATTLI